MTYTVARNARTSYYEVHLDGCRHLTMASRRLEVMVAGLEGESAQAVADTSAEQNEGCLYRVSPCARRHGRPDVKIMSAPALVLEFADLKVKDALGLARPKGRLSDVVDEMRFRGLLD